MTLIRLAGVLAVFSWVAFAVTVAASVPGGGFLGMLYLAANQLIATVLGG